ncbi:PREDICTED: zinc finger protein 62 homolog [Tarenaya hassleriana]|uniref:zinc finger protein 62 homolog n=1 Tax=Tarenaya hassleriana TaxID=28532 RepID=UPI00053C390E|nr:PREDICTED: zinc finger protein 62 homolog [Tarenaya hassleriana]XP_010528396.1 PREDICTED: zinc finger protein 62 homolog [Tarenaya hassleriana]XP_010528397.1 PREDICTED: zinc finger protein 62 homolog [Tarenaya hassleriana]
MTSSDHGLSFCPKKSRNFQSLCVCNVCGKEFQSPKSLYGHTRIHSNRLIPCKVCGEEFSSVKCLINHMVLHRVLVPDEPRICSIAEKSFEETKSLNLVMGDGSLMNKSSCVTEIEQEEMEEVAMSLIMLSEGLHDLDSSGNVSRGDESVALEVKSWNSKRVESEEHCSFDSPTLYNNHDKIKPGMDEPLMDSSEVKLKSSGLQTHSGYIKSSSYTMLSSSSTSDRSKKKSLKKSGYRCKTCHKVFSSYHALGGHQTLHRSERRHCMSKNPNFDGNAFPGQIVSEVCKTGSQINKDEAAESQENSPGNSGYICKTCGKFFSCSKSLGGHQALHRSESRRFMAKNANLRGNSLFGSATSEVGKTGTDTNQHEFDENVTELRNI